MWKPKVGIVGEILAKYHPVANNHIEKVLIEEGAEVVMPDFVDFFLYSAYDPIVKHRLLDGEKKAGFFGRMFINIINFYRGTMRKAMKRSRHFRAPHKIDETARLAERHVSLGNMAGEGWFLTGEMVKLIDEGVPNVDRLRCGFVGSQPAQSPQAHAVRRERARARGRFRRL